MKKTYTYTIEVTSPIFPRHLADMLTDRFLRNHLVSVTDNQRDDHYHGATYHIGDEPEHEDMTLEQMVNFYHEALEQASSEPECDAYLWIIRLLEYEWVHGNMGLLSSYLKEFIETLQVFQAHCERVGSFQ